MVYGDLKPGWKFNSVPDLSIALNFCLMLGVPYRKRIRSYSFPQLSKP